MKKITMIIALALSLTLAWAQVDRSKAPEPAPAREIKIGDYQTFTLKNGLQVFVVENRKLPRVQFTLELKNDRIMQVDKAGLLGIAGDLMGTGTTTRTKAQLDEEVDFIGAVLNTSSNGMFASSLSRHTNRLLELFTDVLYNPAFKQEELDKLKTQTISGITAAKDNPNAIAGNVRSKLLFGKNHPYGEVPTESSVQSITVDDARNYYKTYFKPNNAYLAIVGDIDLKTAKNLAEKYFGKWAAGEVKNPTYTVPKMPAKTFVALVDRSASVQSVINISYPVELKPGTPDVIKSRVTNQILGGDFSARLMQNLREKRGFTYGAYSQLNSDKLIGSFNTSASVRNEVTDSAIVEFMSELKRITSEPVTDKELFAAKASISGSFGRSLESPQTIASFALNTARYNLTKNYYQNYLKTVDAVTKEDVMATASKYIRPDQAYIIVVGKGADVAEKLKPFGEVKYYDVNGENYTPAKASALPADLTGEKIISNYLQAIGGAKKVQELKTMKSVMTATVQGMELVMTVAKKAPGLSLVEMSVGGNPMSKNVTDGKNVMAMQMGQKAPIDDATRETALFEADIVPEANLAAHKVKAVLKSIENVEGKEAYLVEYQFPSGSVVSNYFDKETGLKVQQVRSIKGPQGEISIPTKFSDYKEVSGVKFPAAISITQGPMTLNFNSKSMEANVPLEDALFKVE